jgi:hypothetical protein
MRRLPANVPFPGRPADARPADARDRDAANASAFAGRITPWLVSGGQCYYITSDLPPGGFYPLLDAVQLLCSCYIPSGEIGFLKSLSVAPYMPPEYGPDPISNDLLRWRTPDTAGGPEFARPASTAGLWETPAGWEACFDITDPAAQPPRWRWQLRIAQGTVENLRRTHRNVPPFSIADPSSWFLVQDIPVPASVYAAGLPGQLVGAPFGPDRYQILPGSPLALHIPIPSNSTLLLFASWKQAYYPPYTRTADGFTAIGAPLLAPLLPSVGRIVGYSLPDTQEAARTLAKLGW